MSLENGKCPSCGGALALDSSKEKAVCRFCGHEIIISQALQKFTIDGIATFDTLLLAAQRAVELDGDYDAARKKYREALALAPTDYRVLWGIFECEINSVNWYARTKGYVQYPGDINSNYEEVINKYGNKAWEAAPEDVKPYYFQKICDVKKLILPEIETEKKSCYVATCVYGSYDCPQVWTLRRYRDDILCSTWHGRLAVNSYYLFAPLAVMLFGRMKFFNKICKEKLDKFTEKLKAMGIKDTPYVDTVKKNSR